MFNDINCQTVSMMLGLGAARTLMTCLMKTTKEVNCCSRLLKMVLLLCSRTGLMSFYFICNFRQGIMEFALGSSSVIGAVGVVMKSGVHIASGDEFQEEDWDREVF